MDKTSAQVLRARLEKDTNLLRKVALIAFDMDIAANPYQAIRKYRVQSEATSRIMTGPIELAALNLGVSAEELLNKQKKTEEEEEAIQEAEHTLAALSYDSFTRSRYGQALDALGALPPDIAALNFDEDRPYQPPEIAVLCFFAMHPEISPDEESLLSQEARQELRLLCDKAIDFANTPGKDPATLLKNIPIAEAIERVNTIPVDRLTYPLDKVNSNIWSLMETDTRGQVRFRAEKLGSKKEINILYSIDFDALGSNARITKKLTQFDKRVYIAVAGLFNAGNTAMTLRQIHLAMGGTGRASENQRQKISAAIQKMNGAMISIDNAMEAGTYNYPKFVYTGSLLPVERIKKIVNGNLVEEAIHLFREPPAMTFAKQRAQITTIPVQLLNSHVSMTDTNLAIEDYLLDRIAHAKKGNGQPKILFRTICDKVGATTVKQRQRVPAKVREYLTHYVKCGHIASFAEASDGITVSFRSKGVR